MDRAISPAIQAQRRRRRWLTVAAVLLVAVAGLWAFRGALRPSIAAEQLLTARVEPGDVEASLTATGLIIPAREAVITSPVQSTIRRVNLAVGAKVQPGQAILELDKEQTNTALAKLQDEQLQNRNKSTQLQLTLAHSLTDLVSQEKVQREKVRSLQSALRDEQYLLKVGSGTQESVRQAELTLKIAELELQRLADQIRNQRQANVADEQELRYTMQIQDRTIGELAQKLRQSSISAEQAGVLTWVNEDIGSTVNQGQVIARVADLSSFRVRGTIADAYADSLHLGDAVVVRLNGTDLRGAVSSISPAVEKGVVTFYVALDDNHHPVLRPNLRADVFVVTRSHRRVLRVKNGPFFQGGHEQPVFVVQGGKAVRRTARFGDSNFDYVQVLSGLQAGDELLLIDTKSYEEAPELTIKR
ncbi:HlyD family efflux transporter periplasmic adaptor subunit [Hymenobacter busanensis]|uniref:HlyD family efflux transporter periplasmic adaptor subunit n=1 Tax=Hymenobacter busanensis TaxID=2607656 RepID=A0A7L5A2K1_9BACT|nr:HlyD family efflux transporter periplasmic adaptor subunit [Hymenobacter busanensis]KAA9333311.1 HlyD family efflux transporter periplasmic adaptor subunit [Hymenobacter busanensis]QHJ08010.1 HlyD family efflux transporter periplasmic adaptor subunit [Hymenobacter busanensis]